MSCFVGRDTSVVDYELLTANGKFKEGDWWGSGLRLRSNESINSIFLFYLTTLPF